MKSGMSIVMKSGLGLDTAPLISAKNTSTNTGGGFGASSGVLYNDNGKTSAPTIQQIPKG